MRFLVRVYFLVAGILGAGATASAAQDVVQLGREHGVPVPDWVREALARDPQAFEVRYGWRPALERAKAQRLALAQRGFDVKGFPAAAAAAYGTAVTGAFEVPVLAIMFENTAAEPYPVALLQSKLFGTSPDTLTLTRYYTENSRGAVTVTGTVSSWARAAYKDTYYEGADNGSPPYIGELLREAVEQADATIDFSRYDSNDDGIVDAVAFVHAESGGECGNANIWSHRWNYAAASGGRRLFTKDGVEIVDYSIQPAFACNGVTPIEIGVFAHETGHLWGLPDLYSTNYSNEGIGLWGLMGAGGWNTPSSPSHLSAWSKVELGWLPVRSLSAGASGLRLDAAETTGDAIRIDIPTSPGEYFLLENRQRLGSDVNLKGTGLLVWHVDSAVIANRLFSNSVQNDAARKGVDLVEADGTRALDTPGGATTGAQTFPGSTYNYTFTGTTNPGTASNDGLATGIALRNILESGGAITFDLAFESVACAPGIVVIGQTHAGTLTGSDCARDGKFYDAWVLNVAASTLLRMDLSSTAFDAYLVLADTKGNVLLEDDDGAGTDRGDARIEATLAPGQYILWATTYAAGDSGSYSIAVAEPESAECSSATVATGQTAAGALATTDCSVGGFYFDHFALSLAAEATVQLTLASDDFDTRLILQDAAGNEIAQNDDYLSNDTDSRITQTLPAGTYNIWVTSYSVGDVGAYTLEALDQTESQCVPAALALGAQQSGALSTLDCEVEGRYFDAWIVDVAADTTVTIELSSTDFDAFLVLSDTSGNVLATDDDAGAGTNSLLERVLPAGRYVVWASTYAPGATGEYTLRARENVLCSSATVALGQFASGGLSTDDCSTGGRFHDAWVLDLAADTAVRVSLTSSDFDTHLLIADAEGNTLFTDDDGGTGNNSLVEADLAAGRYVIWASSYAAGATGAYALEVKAPTDASCSSATIALGATVTGELTTADCAVDGRHLDAWVLELNAETNVELYLASDDFDAVMKLTDESGSTLAENDDAEDGTNAAITMTLAAGRYTVWATTFEPGETGTYQLTAAESSSGTCSAAELALGQTVSGTLTTTDCPNQDRYWDPWILTLTAQTSVDISVTSSAFDTYLILADLQGNVLGENNDAGGTTNSRIQATLAAGNYAVWITSAATGATGDYSLTATGSSSGTTACHARGDVNADGTVDRKDVELALDWIARGAQPDAAHLARADVNSNGAVDLADARAIADIAAGRRTPGAAETSCQSGVTQHE